MNEECLILFEQSLAIHENRIPVANVATVKLLVAAELVNVFVGAIVLDFSDGFVFGVN